MRKTGIAAPQLTSKRRKILRSLSNHARFLVLRLTRAPINSSTPVLARLTIPISAILRNVMPRSREMFTETDSPVRQDFVQSERS